METLALSGGYVSGFVVEATRSSAGRMNGPAATP